MDTPVISRHASDPNIFKIISRGLRNLGQPVGPFIHSKSIC